MAYKKNKQIWSHVIACILLLLLPIIDAPSSLTSTLEVFKNPFVDMDFFFHAACILFGYLNYYLLLPALFYKPGKISYISLASALFILVCCLPLIFPTADYFGFLPLDSTSTHVKPISQIKHIFFFCMVIFLFTLMSWNEMRLRQTEREKSIAELRYLKAQINPHFLFNTLNSIYMLVQTNPEKAGSSLIKMSNIMRYILHAPDNNYEPLSQEIAYLEDYISLQRDRFGNTVDLEYVTEVKPEGLEIAPLLLIPFVENAFKYGVNPEFPCDILIKINTIGNKLMVYIQNNDYSAYKSGEPGNGTGIANASNRLNLLYKNKHSLNTYKNYKGMFIVDLQIVLD